MNNLLSSQEMVFIYKKRLKEGFTKEEAFNQVAELTKNLKKNGKKEELNINENFKQEFKKLKLPQEMKGL